ncbi:hypothetical protein [Prevotella nigrescens]|uniref:hypothetical protein n=1 Tax=Prevotella nigrescens TaxID=28133 RepID=UPI003606443A
MPHVLAYSSDITIIFLYVELIARAYNDLGLWGRLDEDYGLRAFKLLQDGTVTNN